MNNENKNIYDLQTINQQLYNNTQKIVLEIMEDLLKQPKYQGICTCPQCLKDIAAYALNRLPAKYINSSPEQLVTKILEFENKVNVNAVSIVKKAIKVVSTNPRHSLK